jgi:uncharacterized surface protein with fasciclin (FAS1) repeats
MLGKIFLDTGPYVCWHRENSRMRPSMTVNKASGDLSGQCRQTGKGQNDHVLKIVFLVSVQVALILDCVGRLMRWRGGYRVSLATDAILKQVHPTPRYSTMNIENAPERNPWTIAVVLAVALGPLTALALGSKYADEETRERARAGLVNATPSDALDPYDTTRSPGYASGKTLGDITGGSAVFSQLQAAIKAAGSEAMLEGEGEYTIFAPSNEAFERVPKEQLAAIMADPAALQALISAHIAPGRLSATEMMQGFTATNLAGQRIPVGVQGNLKVGDAAVSQSIVAKNGIVHVIDRVML